MYKKYTEKYKKKLECTSKISRDIQIAKSED